MKKEAGSGSFYTPGSIPAAALLFLFCFAVSLALWRFPIFLGVVLIENFVWRRSRTMWSFGTVLYDEKKTPTSMSLGAINMHSANFRLLSSRYFEPRNHISHDFSTTSPSHMAVYHYIIVTLCVKNCFMLTNLYAGMSLRHITR